MVRFCIVESALERSAEDHEAVCDAVLDARRTAALYAQLAHVRWQHHLPLVSHLIR